MTSRAQVSSISNLSEIVPPLVNSSCCSLQFDNEVTSWSASSALCAVALCVVVVISAAAGVLSYWRVASQTKRQKECLREKRRRFQVERRTSLHNLQKYVSDQERRTSAEFTDIVGLNFSQLTKSLHGNSIKPSEALAAYQWKAMKAHRECNSIIHPFEQAKNVATSLDSRRRGRPALYGVPVSLKDDYAVKSCTSAVGVSHLLDRAHTDDCVIVKVLKSKGAVPFMKTTVSQSCLSYESGNPVTGDTLNPYDATRTPGGSSGGECALVGAHGSVLGFGSDIGGSIRLPAHFCGVVGFKPTSNRLSHRGNYSSYDSGQQIVWACWGPISREVDGVVDAMRALLSEELFQRDTRIPPMPFNEQLFGSRRPLKIGYYVDDGVLPATPPCNRAVLLAKQALEAQGHQVVEWKVPNGSRLREVFFKAMFADGGELVKEYLGHDDVHPSLSYIMKLISGDGAYRWLKSKIAKLTNLSFGSTEGKSLCKSSAEDYWKLTAQVEALRLEFMAAWEVADLDGLICPPCAIVATRIGNVDLVFDNNTGLIMYNVLDVPAGVVPVTHVTDDDLNQMREYSEHYDVGKRLQQDMDGCVGIPVGVQCVGPRWREEVVLRVMKDVETGLLTLS